MRSDADDHLGATMQENLFERADECIQLAKQAVAEGAHRGDVRIWRLEWRSDHYQSAADQTWHLQINIWPLAGPDKENRLTVAQAESVIAWLSEQRKECEALVAKYRKGYNEVISMLQARP